MRLTYVRLPLFAYALPLPCCIRNLWTTAGYHTAAGRVLVGSFVATPLDRFALHRISARIPRSAHVAEQRLLALDGFVFFVLQRLRRILQAPAAIFRSRSPYLHGFFAVLLPAQTFDFPRLVASHMPRSFWVSSFRFSAVHKLRSGCRFVPRLPARLPVLLTKVPFRSRVRFATISRRALYRFRSPCALVACTPHHTHRATFSLRRNISIPAAVLVAARLPVAHRYRLSHHLAPALIAHAGCQRASIPPVALFRLNMRTVRLPPLRVPRCGCATLVARLPPPVCVYHAHSPGTRGTFTAFSHILLSLVLCVLDAAHATRQDSSAFMRFRSFVAVARFCRTTTLHFLRSFSHGHSAAFLVSSAVVFFWVSFTLFCTALRFTYQRAFFNAAARLRTFVPCRVSFCRPFLHYARAVLVCWRHFTVAGLSTRLVVTEQVSVPFLY